MANPALRRRQLARTCKKYGLLIQPNALPILIEEMESRDHSIDGGTSTFGDFLTVLQTKLSRSSATPANLVTLDLVERVLLEEQQEQQQQQAQVLAAKAKHDAKLKKRKQQQQKILIQNEQDDEDEEEIEETSNNNNNYNSLVAVSSKSKLKSKVLSSSSLVPSVGSSSSNITTNKKSKLWKVISAFETPKLVYDSMRKQFRYEQGSASSSLMGSSQDIMTMRIQRYELVKQKVDRSRQEQRLSYLTTIDRLLGTKNNNHNSNNNSNNISSSSAFSGNNKNNKLSLLGMLKSNPSLRCLELEDPTGCVPLRIDLLLDNNNDNNDYDNDNNDIIGCDVDTTGIYLEGSMVLVKGNHEESTLLTTNSEDNDGTVFRCTSIELAPIEVKSITKLHLPPSPYSYDDDFTNSGGGRSSQSNSSSPLPIYSLSNLSLDDPDCIDRLEFVIDRMIQGNKKKRSSSSMEIDDDEDQDENEDNVPDSILVLFGDFCTESTTSSQALDELASVLQNKNIPSKHSILLIPGPNDVGSNACWPLPAWNKKNIPSSMHPFLASNSSTSNISTKRMRDNSNSNNNASSLKGGNVYLCSNPCRLECADGRQVVLLRKDLIRESLQHQVLADADSVAYSNAKAASARGSSRGSSQSQSQSHPSSPSLTSRIIHHALSQGHLSPSSSSQQAASTSCAPIYWNYDHSMTLYPLPDLMIVGLDPEYLDTGFDNNTDSEVGGRTVGCRVVSPASKPSQNEWECSLTTLRSNKKGNKLKLDVEFLKNNDDDDDDSDSDDDDVEEEEKQDQENQNDEEIYENYHMLGGTQTQQSQVSAY